MQGKRVLLGLVGLLVAAAVFQLVAAPRGQIDLVAVPAERIETAGDLSGVAGWRGAAPKSAEAFSFVVISDRTGGAIKGEWASAVEEINRLQPDFVVCVGDLIEGYTEDKAVLEGQWEEFDSLTRKFNAPFFYAPGNHDVTNDVMWELYKERYGVKGKTYYSFDYRGYHFVVLDSFMAIEKAWFAEEQFTWLGKDIARAKDSKHIFVLYHHPRWNNPDLWGRFAQLVPAGKTTVFNGDAHATFGVSVEGGISTYDLSATASNAKVMMFAHVAVDRGKVRVSQVRRHQILPF